MGIKDQLYTAGPFWLLQNIEVPVHSEELHVADQAVMLQGGCVGLFSGRVENTATAIGSKRSDVDELF